MTELSEAECLSLLAEVPVGRVGVSIGALPVVLPVNFVVIDGDVVFRTVAGTKFHAAAGGAVVAFEVDSWHHSGRNGWSVLVQGTATVVTDPAQLADVRLANLDPWAVDGSADRVVRIETVVVSGRRFRRPNGP